MTLRKPQAISVQPQTSGPRPLGSLNDEKHGSEAMPSPTPGSVEAEAENGPPSLSSEGGRLLGAEV